MLESGTLLATYRIVELLASGGMGQVYVAEDTRLERRIALKVLPADMAADPERFERFGREAKVVASLNHPNIVTIHSVEEAEGPDGGTLHFITMELVEGNTLDREIPHGGLNVDRFFNMAVPLADAVGAAHQKGITHRDLKPGNVMLTGDGRLKVLDFGLAKLADDPAVSTETNATAATAATVAGPITEEGKVLGTVAYMSPEQAEGKPVDNRSDIFSLGIMLYEMVTGALPFQGDTKMSLMSSIIKDTPTSVTEVKRELPNHLGRIIKHCLEKDPERRFQSAQDVRNELVGLKEEIDSGEVLTTQSSVTPPPATMAPPANDPSQVSATTHTDPNAAAVPPQSHPSAVSAPAHTDPSVVSAPAHTDPNVVSTPGLPSGEHVAAGGGNKLLLAAAAAVVVVAGLGWWMMSGGEDSGSGVSVSGSGSGASAAETIADTRPSVAVLYFDNLSGDESLDWLRTGLTDLLVTDLSQTPELRVLTTDSLYEILDDSDYLDARTTSAAIVRDVAEQGNVEHVVVGSFIRAGDTFRLSARLQKPSTGETLAAETVEGDGEDSIFESIDDLTRRIRDRLAVPISTTAVVDRDLSDVTTSSMNAYRFYTDGVNLISQSRYDESIPMFERALEIDPEFAMAFAKLSIAYRNVFDFDQSRTFAERAIEHADRLTQRERFYIEGRYYAQDPETTMQSIEAYENALAIYPDDSASRNNVALEYGELEDYDMAIQHLEELLRRGTPFMPSYFNTAAAYVTNGDCESGDALMRDFMRTQPEYHFGYLDLANISMFCGRLDDVGTFLDLYEEAADAGAGRDPLHGNVRVRYHILRDEFDEALRANEVLNESTSPTAQYFVYPSNRVTIGHYRGTPHAAIDELVALTESLADDAPTKAGMLANIADYYLVLGDNEQALIYADRAEDFAQQLNIQARVLGTTAIAQARAGRSVAARTAAQQHDRLTGQFPNPWARRQELFLDAEFAAAEGDFEEAAAQLQQAYDLLPPGPDFPVFDDLATFGFALGLAHYEAGNHLEAAARFREVAESDHQRLLNPVPYVRSFYYLGKIAQQDGDDAEARRNFQRYLDYWDGGDIDVERVDEARTFVDGA